MPLTAEQLKKSGRLCNKDSRESGVWEIRPPLPVIANMDGGRGDRIVVKKGQRYEVSRWCEDGKYSGAVHLHPTAIFWWEMDMFDLVSPLEIPPSGEEEKEGVREM